MKRLALLIMFSLLCRQTALAGPTGRDITIFYSNDVQGETEPCGCQSNQLGGLSKKGFQFHKIAADNAKPHLTLDAGNLLFKESTLNPSQSEQEKMTAKALVRAYALSGYQAVAVGDLDLSAGIDFLRDLTREASFSWLSANLVTSTSRKPIFQPSITLQVGSITASVIGLTGTSSLPPQSDATILPWEEVLPALLDQLSSTTDMFILLSNLPGTENQRIAETYHSIHLIIQSNDATGGASRPPIEINNTLLVSTMPKGQQIGVMDINWQASKQWGDKREESLRKKKAALDSLLWQLSKYRQDKDPESALRDQPERLKSYHLLLDREKILRTEMAGLTESIASKEDTGGEPSSYRDRRITIEESLPGEKAIVDLFGQLDRTINKLGAEKAKMLTANDSPYLGSQACVPCHAEQFSSWKKTKHAAAYATLTNKAQQFNTNCLPCHVTGVSMKQAGESLTVAENRRGVGCESCHGPGNRHVKDPNNNPLSSRPEASLCQGCHTPPHDTTFDYERNKQLVH
ncbi:MAG: UshA-like (seleno)protein [Desulfobulbaceae bacterium]|nr:UshA-like (seleno)protein [Desulfobulbaceae bacterium]